MNNQIEQTLDSREVAEMVGKEHNMLLRDIRRYVKQLGASKIAQSDFWTESTYTNSQNKEMPCYHITKKGCEFIAHKLTGTKGAVFTATYINRFHEMEGALETQVNPIVMQQLMAGQQSFMERQQNFMEELAKMIGTISNRLDVLETGKKEPLGIAVGTGSKPYTVGEDENTARKKKLNRLITKMAKACGWTRSFALHRLYKTMEDVLDISIDVYVDLYKEEVQGDVCTIDAVVASENLYTTAIRLCNNTLSKMSVEV